MTRQDRPQNLPEIEDLPEKISQVRKFVLEDFDLNPNEYDSSDIERLRNDDWFVERFIRKRKTVKDSQEMLKNCLKFRNELGTPRTKDSDFPEEFYKIGGIFCYANDKFGNGVLYMRIKMHHKIKEIERELKQFIIYLINKLDLQTNGNGMVIVFDCQGAGISNLDMDILWFLVSSLLNYYPYGMSYILVYNLPWIFTSAWNVVKGWLPSETREKIKFASKEQIFDYFDKENLPFYLGGTCKIDYHHVPKGCRSVKEHGVERGLTENKIEKLMKNFLPHLEKAEEEMKELNLAQI